MEIPPDQHRWIHDNPAESYARGWLVKSWQDPAEVPITGTWPIRKETEA